MLGIVISAVFVFIQNRQGKQNEQGIERMLQAKVDVILTEFKLVREVISLSTQVVEKSVPNEKEETH